MERGIPGRLRHRALAWCVRASALAFVLTAVSWSVLAAPSEALGPATTVTVALSPSTIVADGVSMSTATATVTDMFGLPVSGDTVGFSTTGGQTFSSTTDNGDGTYTATITSSTTAGTATITATDTSVTPNVSGQNTLIQTAGPAASVTVALSTPSIIADDSSTSTATATVKDAHGNLVATDTVAFSTDAGQTISPASTTANGNGTYTTTITSSTTAGTATITATDTTPQQPVSGSAMLTQTAGPAASVTVGLSPSSIVANGTSAATATATVTDAHGNLVPGDTVVFASSDAGETAGATTRNPDGTYSATIRSSTAIGQATITATDTSVTPNISGSASLSQSPGSSNTLIVASPSAATTNQGVTLFSTVTANTGSPSGAVTFENGGAAIANCGSEPITPLNPNATCQTSFAASSSPEHLTAVFVPDAASSVPGSTGSTTLTVAPDSTSTSLDASSSLNVGVSTTFTATVSPPASRPGPVAPSGAVEFFDGGQPIASCAHQALSNGGATCTVAYNALATHHITAQYGGDTNFNGSTSAAQAVNVVQLPARVLGTITATMQWTFFYAPAYTRVLSLVVNGAPSGATLLVRCHGRGCPFATHARAIQASRRCGAKRKRRCRSHGTIDLMPSFGKHHLRPGARITVMITRPSWIGKYYSFTVRSGRGPRIQIGCLAPGHTRPGASC